MVKWFVRFLWTLLILVVLGTAFAFYAIDEGWIGYMPPIEDLQNPINRYATQVYSADGKLISSVALQNPRTSPTIDKDGNIYVTGSSTSGAILYKITCPKTTAPGSNWSQLGANPQKTCAAPGSNL